MHCSPPDCQEHGGLSSEVCCWLLLRCLWFSVQHNKIKQKFLVASNKSLPRHILVSISMDTSFILPVFLFLASFPSAANGFLLKRSACGKISGPPKSPRCSHAQIPLDCFWKLLPVCHWVSGEKCPLVPAQSWGDVQTLHYCSR